MTERLWLEGHTTIDGRCINIGAVQFNQYDRYPLTSAQGDVVGFITDIQRHDDGWVTGEPVLMPDFHWPKDAAISVQLDMIENTWRFRAGQLIHSSQTVWAGQAR